MDTEGNSRGDPERQERLQDSSAGFTAVNGQDSPVRGVPSHPVGSDLHARSRQGSSEHRPLETKPMAQDPEGWAFTPRNVDKGTTRENQGPQKNDLPISSPGKRKRADSEAEEDSGSAISPYDVGSSSSGQIRQRMDSYASNGPRRESTETAEHAAPGSARQPRVDERSEPHPIPYTHQDVDNNKESGSWYHRERVESPGSDIQLAEALQRDAQAQQQSRANGDGGNESTSPQAPNGSGVQLDPNAKNKRKRMFSNRTKTGCQTCRRRKKKCDEQKPECSNCIRGGFVCEGYTVKTAWSKPGTLTKQPIPLQSKEGYPDQNNMYPKSVTSFSDAYFSRPREENFEHHSGYATSHPYIISSNSIANSVIVSHRDHPASNST
ncbi:hypothetical protein M501DRAFT_608220 [Patellaria atrata CBS 101060]|uniref:Zn(2)-C6 fungal-type domain-containing protein n=1 Tax=Patellaria atrata CBS 101060 TaxID=1346257 RepID=A0A9P4SEX1_9PEZI|nr:hypothetical protein M501DRAFT_608220 [Patellaria atrata CBS 101060]